MKVIYSFHMPLFIAISGYLFYFSLERNGARICLKKRAKLLLPICGTWAFILLFHDTVTGSQFTLAHMVTRLIWNFLTDFWFLWTVLFCVACTATIESLSRTKWGGVSFLSYILLLIIFFVTPDVIWLNAHKFMLPFFVGGYYYAKTKACWLDKNIVGILSSVIWMILLAFYSKSTYIYTTGITVLGKPSIVTQVVIDLYRYLVGTVGTIAVAFWIKKMYYCLRYINQKSVNHAVSLLEKWGKDSLVYYILSTYLFVWIMPTVTKAFELNYFLVLLETIVVMALCDLIKRILFRFGIVSRFVIGK